MLTGRKYESAEEFASWRLCVALVGVGVRDAMVYQYAVVRKEAVDLGEV